MKISYVILLIVQFESDNEYKKGIIHKYRNFYNNKKELLPFIYFLMIYKP